ncbi:MAG TPA: DUF6159 family protein [Actinomycetota bacterium]|nr:DUF6159 family protein [Actinomycetota bacterium]
MASWSVVRQDRQLLILPIVSFVCSVIVIAVFAAGTWGIGLPEGDRLEPVHYVILFLLYVTLAFVTIFFNAAVIGTATERLKGREATIADGLRLAREHLGAIFLWAVVTATVGIVLRTLAERFGFVGRIVISLVGAAWNVVTFFVVPVLLYEPVGVGEGIKRSASLFRQRWGEQFVGNGAIGIVVFVAALAVGAFAFVLGTIAVPLGIAVGVLGIGALMAIGAACSGVFNAALYRYATTGEASGAFSIEDLSSSFRPKGRRGIFGSSTPTRPDL